MSKRLAIAAGLVGVASVSIAATLPAGNNHADLPGTTADADPSLAGTEGPDTTVTVNSGSNSATVTIGVVKSTQTGKYHYYWRVTNAATSPGAINALHLHFWADRTYDANWRIDSLGTGHPSRVSRSDDPMNPGSKLIVFSFDRANHVSPGTSSKFFFLKTDTAATRPATLQVGFTGGGLTADAPAVGPR